MEVLSPAGNLEKIKYAIMYGADAVYAGSQAFSLRAKADNFEHEDLLEAVRFCHERGKKIYVPLNIYAHNRHIDGIKEYIKLLAEANVDAVIVSDLGVFDLVQSISPDMPIHVSTQANVTSYQSVRAFERLGAKRIILARELTFDEIKEIRSKCPDIELEIFIHGAMCIAYSGRCLLSAYLNNRSANLGECTQPCRWRFQMRNLDFSLPLYPSQEGWLPPPRSPLKRGELFEEKRPGQPFPIEEDDHGFYFMNSKDLCLWNRLKEVYEAGIDGIKIEGRMKSLYYVAAVTRAYKQSLIQIEQGLVADEFYREELDKISHRIYTEGFFDTFCSEDTQNYETSTYIRDWQFVGNIIGSKDGYAFVKSYHKIRNTDEIEIIFPDRKSDMRITNVTICDEDRNEIEFTKPNSVFCLKLGCEVPEYGIVRIRN